MKKPKRRRRKRKDEVTDELRAIYEAAKKDGIWILEIGADAGYLAAAGPVSKIERLERELKREIDISKLTLGDIVMRGLAMPGHGETREDACRAAVAACKKDFKIR